jgi:hypothetical protein
VAEENELEVALAAAGAGSPQAGYGSSPPGGMGVTAQGFGQEGYVLADTDMVQPKPPPEDANWAVGVPYYLPFATPYRDSWEVFRDDPVSIKQLIAMRRQDGQARALYRLMTMPILAALLGADVIPPDGQKGGKKEAQFCKDLLFAPPAMGGMTRPFKHVLRQFLLALFDGFSGFELIYWSPKVGPNKGKWTIREIGWRPPQTLTFLLDGQGQFNGFRQRTFFQGRTIDVKVPKETAIYYANEEAERPFYGVSMFEAAFFHYDKKVKLYYLVHLAAQRKAVSMRVGTMPTNPATADKNNFIKGLGELGLASYMVVPSSDWTVNVLQDSGGGFDFLGLINHHNSQMSKSVLAQWFDDAQGGGSGDTGLVDFGKQSDATYLMMLESILEDLAAVITNQIFPRFIDWNFGSSLYPEFKWGALTAEQKAAIQDIFTQLAAAGPQANVSPDFMLELEKKMAESLGLVVDYDKIAKQRQDQQDAMQAQGQDPSQMGALGQFGQQNSPEFDQQQQEQQLQMQQQYAPDQQDQQGQDQQGAQQGQPGTKPKIDPSLLPQGFDAVRATAGEYLDELIRLTSEMEMA